MSSSRASSKRVAGNAERQPDDDHVRQGLAGHVHTLPEAISAEDHAVDVGLEGLDHLRARQPVALGKERDVPLGQPGSQCPGRGVEHLVRGEQDKRLSLGAFQVVGDGLDRHPLEVLGLARGVRQVAGQVDRHLVGIVEGAAQRVGLGGRQTQPRLEEIEPGRGADAERGRGQNAGGNLVEKQLAQARAHVQGSRGQADSRPRSLLQLDPVDLVGGGLPGPARDLVGQGAAPALRGGQLDALLGVLDLGRPLADGHGELL